jgi:hypothetical protein
LFRKELLMFRLQTQLVGQCRFPSLFEATDHQPVLRFDGIVLALGPFDVIARPFEPLSPPPMQRSAFQFEILG